MITASMVKAEVQKGLNAFSLKVAGDYKGKEKVKYIFCGEKNNAKESIFLAPNIITTEQRANDIYKAACDAIRIPNDLSKSAKIGQTEMPMAGEFCSFSGKGVGRGKTTATEFERLLALTTSLTPFKPCLQYFSRTSRDNVCIIPDLSLRGLVDFIKLFKRLRIQRLSSDLLVGKVKIMANKNGEKEYKPLRPLIYRGNFPNPPYSSVLGCLALLGAIGEMTKEKDTSALAKKVVKELDGSALYLIKYGDASVFSFNHYILQMAAHGNLQAIVASLYRCSLYKEGPRNSEIGQKPNVLMEYDKFDLFASRFMQSFNSSAFQDFLSFRAEYPPELINLFLIYFEKMENIEPQIVHSARELGQYLNKVAFFASTEDAKTDESRKDDDKEQRLRKAKAKALTELESSIFSARSGAALIAHVMTRAGRWVGLDAPEAAGLFMEKTCSGELDLEQAKNLLVAFLRIKYKSSKKDETIMPLIDEGNKSADSEQDYSNL